MKQRRKLKKVKTTIILFLLFCGIFYYHQNYYIKEDAVVIVHEELVLENEQAQITEYYIYGTHFNIKGYLNLDFVDKDSNVTLVLKNETIEKEIDTDFEFEDNKIQFYLSKNINNGLYLDILDLGEYVFLLKIKNDDKNYYYSLNNSTKYENIEYYSISNNNISKYITVLQNEQYKGKNNFKIVIVKKELPNNIYDIVIDPGHDGLDPGAVNGNYYEANIVYDYAVDLKEELTKMGYKVFITRKNKTDYLDRYDEGGRVYISNETRAKLLLSIHLNSASGDLKVGGVEVYTPNNINYDFAQLLADNIKNMAKTSYSGNDQYRVSQGVYTRNYLQSDINEFADYASKRNFKLYENLSISTPYYYIIRETGGIITGAYMDGRDKYYGTNEYYDSLVGIESYIIELGYIINDNDLYNIINNKEKYIDAITSSINKYYNKNE